MATVQQLREKQDRLATSINQHKVEIEKIVKNRNDADNELTKVNEDLESIKKSLGEFTAKLETSEKEVRDAGVLIERKDTILAEYDSKIEKATNEYNKQVVLNSDSLVLQSKEKKRIINELVVEKEKLEKEIENNKNSKIVSFEKKESLVKRNSELIDDNLKLIESNSNLEKEIKEKNIVLLSKEIKIEKKTYENEQLREEEKNIEKMIKIKQSNIPELKKEIANLASKQMTEQVNLDKLLAKRVSISKKEDEINQIVNDAREIYEKIGEPFPLDE